MPPHSKQIFDVTLLDAQHPDMRLLKNRHRTALHGNKVWSATLLLLDYLHRQPPSPRTRVFEAGCGWGLPGIFCARHWAADVTACDADAEVFPFLQLHARHNNVSIATLASTFEDIPTSQLQNVDWLIAADICFWDELAEPVFDLVTRAVNAGVGKIVIADPQRPPFFTMAERCVEAFYGEILPRRITSPRRASGALLVIENT